MADLRLRFIGDAGNLKAFFASIGSEADVLVNKLNTLSRVNLAKQLNILPNFARTGGIGSTAINRLTVDVDRYNNALKLTGQTAIRLKEGFLPVADFTKFTGNAENVISAFEKYNTVVSGGRSIRAGLKSDLQEIDELFAQQARTLETPVIASQQRLAALRSQLAPISSAISSARALPSTVHDPVTGRFVSRDETILNPLLQQRQKLISAIGVETRTLSRTEESYQNLFVNDPVLNQLSARRAAVRTTALENLALTRSLRAEANQSLATAVNEEPPSLRNLRYLQQISPNLYQTLQKAGLGNNADEILNKQQAQISAPRADLVRGVTKFNGEFIKTTQEGIPVLQEFSAEVDKNGKIVTRFGGQLSGASQSLQQITRDFQKVIEWTVATTIVFGTLQYTISQLNNLKELDFALQKFAITAQQSPQQAQQSFGRLAEIAHNTATPLLEIVGAADDIALATQRAGQSTEEWNREIFSLTESVGVFTNLTGTDTVTATDLLTATMKQLRLTAADIPAILSKITAVAGGQSQAISDITKGLSVMAEAGRIANLTIDQQIATVQVLSQVTSKTPAEVATAFKNLVGSLGSPGALKGLEQFNIGVRTQGGELRNILDVYGEISDKIKSGIIPAADVQGLIRAISGGPRRAPDAAALLAAVDQITTAQQKSSEATNEAAIANAKAIDTTKAKLIQLQTTIDAVTFEKFGGEFKTAVGTMVTLLSTLLKAFNAVPSGAIAAAIQVGLFFIAIKTGTRVLLTLGGILNDIRLGFLAAGTAALTSAKEVGVFNSVKSGGGTLLSGIGKNAGRIGAGIALGAGLSAATGGTTPQIIGGGLQGLGVALLAFPEPTLLTKIAGGIALLGGTLIQFAGATKDVAEADADKAARVLDSFSQFKSASQDVNSLTLSQRQLTNQIDELNKKTDKTSEDYNALDSAQRDYAKGILDTINATKQAVDARQALIDALSGGTAEEQAVANELRLADRYGVTGKALDDLIFKYQTLLLLRINPDLVVPDLKSLPPPPASVLGPPKPFTGNTQTTVTQLTRGGNVQYPFDLEKLTSQFNNVKGLFNSAGTELTSAFEKSPENIQLVTDAITKLIESGDPLGQTLSKTFNAFLDQDNIIKQTSDTLAIYQAYIDSIQLYDPKFAAEAQKVKDIVDNISNPQVKQEGTQLLFEGLKAGAFDYQKIKTLALDYYNSLTPEEKKHTTAMAFMAELLTALSDHFAELGIVGPTALQAVSDAIDASEKLDNSLDSIRSSITDRLTKAQQDLQTGDINTAQYDKLTANLKKYLAVVDDIGPKFKKSIVEIPGFAETLQSVQGEFGKVVGLENAASLTSDEFVSKLLELGDTYGLNGKQLDDLAIKLANFHRLVENLNKIAVNIPIGVSLDLTSVRAALQKLRLALQHSTGGPASVGNPLVAAQLQGLLDLEKILSQIDSSASSIQRSYRSGSGNPIGSGGSSSSAKQGPGRDISELDLPKEIADAINESELIKQAIANAKKLQAQIPGARKDAKNDTVVLLDGMNKVLSVHGVKSEYLRRALDELAAIEQKRLDFETKADTIRRIRVGAGDFSAIANVPVNSTTGVSLGGANGPINITLNLNGTVLTPAQLAQFADLVAGALKKQLAG